MKKSNRLIMLILTPQEDSGSAGVSRPHIPRQSNGGSRGGILVLVGVWVPAGWSDGDCHSYQGLGDGCQMLSKVIVRKKAGMDDGGRPFSLLSPVRFQESFSR